MDEDSSTDATSKKHVEKLSGFQFWEETLRSAKYVVAPMVDQSELAWRMLSRRHGADLCYTPMFHSSVFVRDAVYRRDSLATCPEDRPLIVQFCGNDPETILKAGKLAEHMCDAIDLNLGCPQSIAKRGRYGAYLQDEWELLEQIISLCHKELSIPITVKIRVYDSIEKTVEYAKMLERAGAQLLTVHGRTKEQKGPLTGLASWKHIKAVKEAVKIPVFANGNIQYLTDVGNCMAETGVQGVMIAEGSLHNPALFDGVNPPVWDMVDEYMSLAELYPCNLTYVRGHIFKMCIHSFDVYNEWRMKLGECKTLERVKEVMAEFLNLLRADADRYYQNPESFQFGSNPFPYWICQPYVRPDPTKETTGSSEPSDAKRQKMLSDVALKDTLSPELQRLSKKKLRKALQKPNKPLDNIYNPGRGRFEMCDNCKSNARGLKCDMKCCKVCCRSKCRELKLNCPGHNLYYKAGPPRQERQTLTEKTTPTDTNERNDTYTCNMGLTSVSSDATEPV